MQMEMSLTSVYKALKLRIVRKCSDDDALLFFCLRYIGLLLRVVCWIEPYIVLWCIGCYVCVCEIVVLARIIDIGFHAENNSLPLCGPCKVYIVKIKRVFIPLVYAI